MRGRHCKGRESDEQMWGGDKQETMQVDKAWEQDWPCPSTVGLLSESDVALDSLVGSVPVMLQKRSQQALMQRRSSGVPRQECNGQISYLKHLPHHCLDNTSSSA